MSMLALAFLAFVVQSPPARPASAISVQGVVVTVGTGDPLAKVTVELRGDDANAAPLRVLAGSDGRFAFRNLRPGRYQLTATRAGYVRSPMTVTVGQQLREIRVPMTPSATIFGRVTDEKGEAVAGVEVRAMRASYQEGRRALTVARSVETNDLGEYRLFWLQPGRYYVSASHPGEAPFRVGGSFGGGGGGPNGPFFLRSTADPDLAAFGGGIPEKVRYVPIFFPGTVDEQSASAIDVRAGAEFGEVNLVVAPVQAHRVRGTIINGATGQPAQFGGLKQSSSIEGALRPDKPFEEVDPTSGAFELELLPGSHTLIATAGTGVGYAVVQVGDTDLDNVTIVTAPTFSMSARLSVEGRAGGNNADFASLRVSLRRDPAIPGASSSSYSVPLSDGTFALEATPGDFRVNLAPILNVTPAPPFVTLPKSLDGAYVKSIRLGDADVLNGGLHLQRPPEAPLEIVLGTSPGSIDGRVASRALGGDVSVVLLPDVRRRTDLYRSVSVDAAGRFRFERVPPGDYRVFAWSDAENGAWYDAEFVRSYENRGAPVRVDDGKTATVEVMVIE